jgi:hypothetical protein
VERRPHGGDFPVERNEQPAPACAYVGGRALQDTKVPRSLDEPENATASEPEHRKPALGPGDIKTQLASIEPFSSAKRRQGDQVFIVSNEYEWAAARLDIPFDNDRKPE